MPTIYSEDHASGGVIVCGLADIRSIHSKDIRQGRLAGPNKANSQKGKSETQVQPGIR